MLETIIAAFAPHDCLVCYCEGSLLCDHCKTDIPSLPERCYRCRALSPGGRTCATCRKSSNLHSVQVATEYAGVAKNLVWKLKFAHARAAIRPIAELMARRLVFDDASVLVPIPTATGRVRQRGYDQALLLCQELSRRTRVPRSRLLGRHGQTRQVGAHRNERINHLAGAFSVRNQRSVVGRHIVLVDDVLTTGATLEAAAKMLKQAGALRVEAVVFAQA